jgi:tRNA threonylcarbamoyladenosine biosynthesis protein TsaB
MTSLYLDTSHLCRVGILDDSFSWLTKVEINNTKSASQIHYVIYESLKSLGLKISDVDNLIYGLGPGSYTGVRVTEGFSQIAQLSNLKRCSFYHFEVPYLSGISKGDFFSNAFKSEIFVHSWNNETNSSELKSKKFCSSVLNSSDSWTHYRDDRIFSEDLAPNLTSELIDQKPKLVFEKIVERAQTQEPFYYRRESVEFKPSISD